jgi:hypothetical protein
MTSIDAQATLPGPNWWRKFDICRSLSTWFQKHLLALHVVVRFDGKTEHLVYSGFLLYHLDMLMWVTAGHVIQRMTALTRDSRVKVLHAAWLDHHANISAGAIPVDLDGLLAFMHEPDGLDFGVVGLRPAYALPILSNPDVIVLNEVIWHGLDESNPDCLFLVGYPGELKKAQDVGVVNGRRHGVLDLAVVVLPIERIPDRPGEGPTTFWGRSDSVYGHLLPFSDSDAAKIDIAGLSGGPIFAVSREKDSIRYRLAAIQGSWLPNSRIIRGASIVEVARIMEDGHRQAMQHLELPLSQPGVGRPRGSS